jgi:hypothetical protein
MMKIKKLKKSEKNVLEFNHEIRDEINKKIILLSFRNKILFHP